MENGEWRRKSCGFVGLNGAVRFCCDRREISEETGDDLSVSLTADSSPERGAKAAAHMEIP